MAPASQYLNRIAAEAYRDMEGIVLNVQIPINAITLEANLDIPEAPQGTVIFAHGSGSSCHSPRNTYVAEALRRGNPSAQKAGNCSGGYSSF